MAQVDLLSKQGATYVGLENIAYGATPASLTRCFPDVERSSIRPTRQVVQVTDERTRLFQYIAPVLGPEGGEAALTFDLRPPTDQLVAAASPADNYLSIVLKALLGGEARAAGSLVATGTSATQIDVTGGQGSRFPVGTWVLVGVSGTLEPTRVINQATDTLTLRPALSGTPGVGQLVVNTHCFFATQDNAQSLCLEHAKAGTNGANFQWRVNGATGDLELRLERGELAQATANLRFPSFLGPSNLGVATTAGTDTLATQHLVYNSTTLLQTPATTTRTHYPLESLVVRIAGGMVHLPELGGSVENTVGVMRVGSRPLVTATLRMRADVAHDASFAAGTTQSLMVWCPLGSGTTKRFVGVDLPTAVITAQPQHVDEGGRLVTEIELSAMEDATTTTSGLSGTNLDRALSPIRVFVG